MKCDFNRDLQTAVSRDEVKYYAACLGPLQVDKTFWPVALLGAVGAASGASDMFIGAITASE